tara:strand:- start:348 stop:527 length:180 start_codon:yes stop_codon:yes gene_type:complete
MASAEPVASESKAQYDTSLGFHAVSLSLLRFDQQGLLPTAVVRMVKVDQRSGKLNLSLV